MYYRNCITEMYYRTKENIKINNNILNFYKKLLFY